MFSNLSIKVSWTLNLCYKQFCTENSVLWKSFPDARQCSQADSQAWGQGGRRWFRQVQLKVCWLWVSCGFKSWFHQLLPGWPCRNQFSCCGTGFFICGLGCPQDICCTWWLGVEPDTGEQRTAWERQSSSLSWLSLGVCSNVILGYNCSRVIQEQQQTCRQKKPRPPPHQPSDLSLVILLLQTSVFICSMESVPSFRDILLRTRGTHSSSHLSWAR